MKNIQTALNMANLQNKIKVSTTHASESVIGNSYPPSKGAFTDESKSPVVESYTNLFDAIVDTIISAMENLGYDNIPLIVTESGWPSGGNINVATIEYARTYNNNLIRHVLSNAGTPKRPGRSIETYIFALFNEDKPSQDDTERHYGLFYPNKSPVYEVNFSP
eukprot:PITA_10649